MVNKKASKIFVWSCCKLEKNGGKDALGKGAVEKDKSLQCTTLLHMIGEESLDIFNTFTSSKMK